jgi:pyridoxine 4-dehydrogenase
MTTPGGTTELAGRPVARIGFGAMQLTADGTEVLRRAVDQGVNHVDTAQFYGVDALSNRLIRAALHPYGEDLTLVSKVGAALAGEHIVPAQRPAELRRDVEANLATLGADALAVVNLRRMDAPPGLLATGDQAVDLDDQLAELTALRDEGKIAAIGLSNVDAAQVERAVPAGIACVQNAYSVLDRGSEAVLEVCRTHGIAWVPFFPLGSAFPQIPKTVDHPTVIAVADRLGVTPAQVSLAWLLAHHDRTLLIPGTNNPKHLDENIAAGSVELDPETVAELDAIAG